MEKVILESPYQGDEMGMKINEIYGEFCMHDMLVNHNESPYASHLLYTRNHVLRDWVAKDRELGIKAGFEWRVVAERSAFYCDLGMTKGMEQGIKDVNKKGGRYDIRWLPDSLWRLFVKSLRDKELSVPERIKKI